MENSTLVKFGRLEHLEALRDRGELFMNTAEHFRRIEDDELRGDQHDCADKVVRHSGGIIKLRFPGGKEIVGHVNEFEYWEHTQGLERTNLFCMYALRPASGSFPVSEKNFQFGEYALALLQPQEYIDRILAFLKKNRIVASTKLVEYVHGKYAGQIGSFRKRDIFAYQSE